MAAGKAIAGHCHTTTGHWKICYSPRNCSRPSKPIRPKPDAPFQRSPAPHLAAASVQISGGLFASSRVTSRPLLNARQTLETGLMLQQNTNFNNLDWVTVTNAVTVVGTNNRVSISPLTGNRFFRLVHS